MALDLLEPLGASGQRCRTTRTNGEPRPGALVVSLVPKPACAYVGADKMGPVAMIERHYSCLTPRPAARELE